MMKQIGFKYEFFVPVIAAVLFLTPAVFVV